MRETAEDDPRKAGTIWTLGPDDPTVPVAPVVAVDFERVWPSRSAELALASGAEDEAEVCRRLESERRCYGAWVEGRLAAYGWVSFSEEWIGELRLELQLQPGEAYIWDCVTLPEFRQKGLYSALLVFIAGELRREATRRFWIGADLENLPSQKGIARAGFRAVAHLVIERQLGMRMVWAQGVEGAPEELVADVRRVFLRDRDRVWLAALSAAG
jgi:ribosomal protein S18 acetylase RimI-like enzyme